MNTSSYIELLIRNNIANNRLAQSHQEILAIAIMMLNSEEAKIIALKLIKKGLESEKRVKFRKTLYLISRLCDSKDLKQYFKTNLIDQLGIIDNYRLDVRIKSLKPLIREGISSTLNNEELSRIKTLLLDLLKRLNFLEGPTCLKNKIASLNTKTLKI